MKKSQKKWTLTAVFALLAIYILAIVFVPRLTLAVDAGATVTAVYDHFVMMKDNLFGDATFLALVLGLLAALYWFLVYRPKSVKKGRGSKDISTVRKLVFVVALVYGLLLIIVPWITLPVDAAAGLVTFQTHFIDVKEIFVSDVSFLAISAAILGGGYYFLVYKPKL